MRHRAISTKLLLFLMFASIAYVTLLCTCSGSKTTDASSSSGGSSGSGSGGSGGGSGSGSGGSGGTSSSAASTTFVYVTTLTESSGTSGSYYTGSGGISEFQMATTGVLTKVPGSPLLFGSNMPTALAADPLGRFLFGASAGNIYTFRIASNTGALTEVANFVLSASTYSAGGLMAVAPSGNYLYALTPNGLYVFAIGANGVLGYLQTIATAIGSSGIALDNAGKFLYTVTSFGAGASGASVFSVDSASGILTSVGEFPPYQFGTGGMAVNPNGNFIYLLTASPVADLVFENASGTVTQVQQTTCGCNSQGDGKFVLVHPSGKFLYETVGNQLAGLTIATDGTLGAAISPSSGFFLTPTTGLNVAIGLDPGGNFLFASQSLLTGPTSSLGTPVVTTFAVNTSSGFLTQIPGSPFKLDVAGSDPFATVAMSVPQ